MELELIKYQKIQLITIGTPVCLNCSYRCIINREERGMKVGNCGVCGDPASGVAC